MDVIGCPECDVPADVVPRTPDGGTPRPWDYVLVTCVSGHWFLLPAQMLPGWSAGGPDPVIPEPRRPQGH